MLSQASNSLIGLTHPPATFESEGFGDDANSQCTTFLGDFCDDGRSAGSCAATHACGNEDQIGPLDGLLKIGPGFFSRFLADAGIATSAEPPCEGLTKLDAMHRSGLDQGLRISVQNPIGHPIEITDDHAVHSVAATTTNTDDFNAGRLARKNSFGRWRRRLLTVHHLHR